MMLSHLKFPENNYIITAPGAHIVLVFYDARSFDNPRINNHSATATISLIVLGYDSAQSFETTQKNTVSLHQVPRFC